MGESNVVRGINRWDLTAIAVNTIIGAGIFGLPSKVTALIGGYSLLAFVVCAFIVGFIVLCFAEVASRFTATGGMYLYAREAFGAVAGFEVGWLYWIVRITTFAANCNLLLAYLGFFRAVGECGRVANRSDNFDYFDGNARQFSRRERVGDSDEHFHRRKNRAAAGFYFRRNVFHPARQFFVRRYARLQFFFERGFAVDLRLCRF